MLIDAIGYIAAGLVFATFCAQRMSTLRSLAIASNLAFIGYGYADRLWPILILHCAMLPINVLRYRQFQAGAGEAKAATVERSKKLALLDPVLPENLMTMVTGQLRSWRERENFRREVASMSTRDFSNLKVPPSLVADELRRWPWQAPSPQWRVVGSKWSTAYRGEVDDRSYP